MWWDDAEQPIIGRLRLRLNQVSWAKAGPELGNLVKDIIKSIY